VSDFQPYRLATYKFKLTLPTAPDGPERQPVEWNFARKVDIFASDEELTEMAKQEFLRWCDEHLEIGVEASLVGSSTDVAKHYEEKVREVVEEVATILYLSDSSDYRGALHYVLDKLAPGTSLQIEEGSYRPPRED
jgi:hypothetical protein